jgi:hypothetical protein
MEMGSGWGGQGSAFNIALSYEVAPNRLLSLRYTDAVTRKHCDEIVLFIPMENPIGRSSYSVEVDYGILSKNNFSVRTLSVGLSYLDLQEAGGTIDPAQNVPILYYSTCPADYNTVSKKTVGISLMAEFVPSLKWGGLGIMSYINLNTEHVFGSVTINMAFGRIRS